MNWFRSSRWAVAGVAAAALGAWLLASNHCLVTSFITQAKEAHSCCHQAPVPMNPSMSCCTSLNADIPVALHAPASEGEILSGDWAMFTEIPGPVVHPPMLQLVSTGPPSVSIFTAIACRKAVPAHAPPGFVA